MFGGYRMTSFRFLHAADIHLDSPLRGLSRYEGLPADRLRRATRDAFDNLISAAIREKVAFVVIAGDLFDGDWKDMSTGLYFAGAMGRLAEASIRVFVLKGNHDADCSVTRSLPWPENVAVFSSRRAETHDWPEVGVALHGRSFPTANVQEDLSAEYPLPIPGRFNVGVLHTALGGYAQHQPYAPCTLQSLVAKGYDYWALGHVHAREVLQEDPWVVFPGNLQGRHIRETGAKGATLVDVEDGRVLSARALALDVVRWIQAEVDCTDAVDESEVHARIRRRLREIRATDSQNCAAIARVVLNGSTPIAGRLSDRRDALRDEVCAIAEALDDVWIEKLVLRTAPPTAHVVTSANDAIGILNETLGDPALLALLADDLKPFLDGLPTDACEADGLQEAARNGRLSELLASASVALRERLAAEAG
jgi:DNA repair protein SbcD/Mre11